MTATDNSGFFIPREDPADAPIEKRPPTLRAKVLLLEPRDDRRTRLEGLLPDPLRLESFADADAFARELSGNVAVTLCSLSVAEARLQRVVKRTISVAEHAQVALVADQGEPPAPRDVPHDQLFVPPLQEKTLVRTVKRLYVRAYYSATLQRLYLLNAATMNHELQLETGMTDDEERLHRLEKATELTKSYLRQFRDYLEPEDLEALSLREETLENVPHPSQTRFDPSVWGLPDTCPECGLDWTVRHGPRLGSGYEKIGADTWRCTRCSHVISDARSPEHWIA